MSLRIEHFFTFTAARNPIQFRLSAIAGGLSMVLLGCQSTPAQQNTDQEGSGAGSDGGGAEASTGTDPSSSEDDSAGETTAEGGQESEGNGEGTGDESSSDTDGASGPRVHNCGPGKEGTRLCFDEPHRRSVDSDYAMRTYDRPIVTGSFFRSGWTDIALEMNASRAEAFVNNGRGWFETEERTYEFGLGMTMTSADVDGDGLSDLVSRDTQSELGICYGSKDGYFEFTVQESGHSQVWDMIPGNFIGDSEIDVFLNSTNPMIAHNHGQRAFELIAAVQDLSSGTLILRGHFDADPYHDLLTIDRFSAVYFGDEERGPVLGRSFDATEIWRNGLKPVAGDLDGDGVDEVIVAQPALDRIDVYRDFDQRNPDTRDPWPEPWLSWPVAGELKQIELADVNLDGRLDVVTTHDHPSRVEVALRTHSDELETAFVLEIPHLESVVVFDFDKDGRSDLIAHTGYGSDEEPASPALLVYLGVEDVQGATPTDCSGAGPDPKRHCLRFPQHSPLDRALSQAVLDQDGDGDLDQVVLAFDDIESETGRVALRRNDGKGRFSEAEALPMFPDVEYGGPLVEPEALETVRIAGESRVLGIHANGELHVLGNGDNPSWEPMFAAGTDEIAPYFPRFVGDLDGEPSSDEILHFHRDPESGDPLASLLRLRDGTWHAASIDLPYDDFDGPFAGQFFEEDQTEFMIAYYGRFERFVWSADDGLQSVPGTAVDISELVDASIHNYYAVADLDANGRDELYLVAALEDSSAAIIRASAADDGSTRVELVDFDFDNTAMFAMHAFGSTPLERDHIVLQSRGTYEGLVAGRGFAEALGRYPLPRPHARRG